jgi:predicted lipoprotein with Yx(FWY)xxD motif
MITTLAPVILLAFAVGAHAQMKAAQGPANPPDQGRPPGVSSGPSKIGPVYVESRGLTLYAMSRRYASFRAPNFNGLIYCQGPCTQVWTVFAAPADAKPVGLWSIVEGAQGPQWAYKGDPVFTYAQDSAAGATGGDGYEDIWKAIAYVPPMPKFDAPANIVAVYADGAYILADGQGRALFTGKASDAWLPLSAGLASQGVGKDWTVSRDGDRPQWEFQGKLVYVSQETVPTKVPAETAALHP